MNLTGLWESIYRYESASGTKLERQILEIRQFGEHVVAADVEYQAHPNRLSGRFANDKFFTGTWHNRKEQLYEGAFQFSLHNNGEQLDGQWVGFNSQNLIRNGPWILRRISLDFSEENKRMSKSFKLTMAAAAVALLFALPAGAQTFGGFVFTPDCQGPLTGPIPDLDAEMAELYVVKLKDGSLDSEGHEIDAQTIDAWMRGSPSGRKISCSISWRVTSSPWIFPASRTQTGQTMLPRSRMLSIG